jgi:hypothetical protein
MLIDGYLALGKGDSEFALCYLEQSPLKGDCVVALDRPLMFEAEDLV